MSSGSLTREEQLIMLNQALRQTTEDAVLFTQAVATQAGIHSTDVKVLSLLSRHGAMSAGHIAELIGLSTGAVTFMIDRLEKAGYAHRVRHPTDRRSVLIELNLESLQETIVKLFALMDQAVKQVVECYSDAELSVILDFMTRMNEASEHVITHVQKDF